MDLAEIISGPQGFELRNFKCEKCDLIVATSVATDPMQSDVTGWLNGELGSKSKPPHCLTAVSGQGVSMEKQKSPRCIKCGDGAKFITSIVHSKRRMFHLFECKCGYKSWTSERA